MYGEENQNLMIPLMELINMNMMGSDNLQKPSAQKEPKNTLITP